MDSGHSASVVIDAPKKKKPIDVLDLIRENERLVDGDHDDGRFADIPGALVVLRNKGDLKPETHEGITAAGFQKDLICPKELLLSMCETL